MTMTNKEREEKIQKYIGEHEGVSYREAVLAVLDKTETENEPIIKKEEDFKFAEGGTISSGEVKKTNELIDVVLFNLSLLKKLDSFPEEDQKLLDQAYQLVGKVRGNAEMIFSRNR